jgi:hypothetical protein
MAALYARRPQGEHSHVITLQKRLEGDVGGRGTGVGVGSPVSGGLGGGVTPLTGGDHRRLGRSQSECPLKRAGAGSIGRGGPGRFKTQPGKASSPPTSGAALGGHVRRRAPPRGSLRPRGTSPDQTPPGACVSRRGPGPVEEPGGFALALGQVFSPSGSSASEPEEGSARPRWRRQQRPLCGARGRFGCRRCPSVYLPIPGGMELSGPTRRRPARSGTGRGGAFHRAPARVAWEAIFWPLSGKW